jgi:hypothetical protein
MTTNPSIAPVPLTAEAITTWVNRYLRAWKTDDRDDIAALFSEDAECHERPFDTEWIGRDEIVEGWRSRWDWQQGGWDFDWSITNVQGSTVVITGVGRYVELGVFDNVWTVTFDDLGRSTRFEMLNTERA